MYYNRMNFVILSALLSAFLAAVLIKDVKSLPGDIGGSLEGDGSGDGSGLSGGVGINGPGHGNGWGNSNGPGIIGVIVDLTIGGSIDILTDLGNKLQVLPNVLIGIIKNLINPACVSQHIPQITKDLNNVKVSIDELESLIQNLLEDCIEEEPIVKIYRK